MTEPCSCHCLTTDYILEMGLPVVAVRGTICAKSVCNGTHLHKQFHSTDTSPNFPALHFNKQFHSTDTFPNFPALHFNKLGRSLIYELIYQLNAIEYLLCTFSSTCFGLTRPSSGAMDVKFLYIYSTWCPWCS